MSSTNEVREVMRVTVTTEMEERLRQHAIRNKRGIKRAPPRVFGATVKDVEDGDEKYVNGVRKAWADERREMRGQRIYVNQSGNMILRPAREEAPVDPEKIARQIEAIQRELEKVSRAILLMSAEGETTR